MKNRVFTRILCGAVAVWPLAAVGQQPTKLRRVGWIWNRRSAGDPTEVAGFRQGLKELGYIEGPNIVVDYRFGEGNVDRAAELAAELAHDDNSRRNAGRRSGRLGLGVQFARLGGNITGVSMMQGLEGLAGKRIELFKDTLPNATRIGLMFWPGNPAMAGSLVQAEEVANRLGMVIRPFPVQRPKLIELMSASATPRPRC